jgi:hypothetical protein
MGIRRVWFLLPSGTRPGLRGQLHRRLTTAASAPPSTGVFTLRRTAGELAHIAGGVQVAVQDLAAVRILTAEHAVRELKNRIVYQPQAEQVLLDGSQREASTTWLPYHSAL